MPDLKKPRSKNSDRFTGPHQVEMEDWIGCAPFEQFLGMKIVQAEEGRAVLTMPFTRELAQGAGLMHGGALVSLADTAVVMAIKSKIPPDTHFATISMESKFLYPVKQGIVTAEAEVLEQEGRVLKGRALILNEERREVFQFLSVFKISSETSLTSLT